MDKSIVKCRGFLKKSPPEDQIRGSRLFSAAAKWRFFQLVYNPNITGHKYRLIYYKDPSTKKPKGEINLVDVRTIVKNPEKALYENEFVVSTLHRGRPRDYHLAAKHQDDTEQWVNLLAIACKLTTGGSVLDGMSVGTLRPSRGIDLGRATTTVNMRTLPQVRHQPSMQAAPWPSDTLSRNKAGSVSRLATSPSMLMNTSRPTTQSVLQPLSLSSKIPRPALPVIQGDGSNSLSSNEDHRMSMSDSALDTYYNMDGKGHVKENTAELDVIHNESEPNDYYMSSDPFPPQIRVEPFDTRTQAMPLSGFDELEGDYYMPTEPELEPKSNFVRRPTFYRKMRENEEKQMLAKESQLNTATDSEAEFVDVPREIPYATDYSSDSSD